MKILKIVSSHDEGGVLSCESQFIQILRNKGVQVDVLIVGNGVRREGYEKVSNHSMIVKDCRIKFSGGLRRRSCALIQAFKWGRSQSREVERSLADQYDAIMYRRQNFMFFAGSLARRLKVRCYWHMAGTINSSLARLLHQVVSRVFSIIPLANSEYTKSTFGSGCKYVVYPGFDKERLLNDTGGDEFSIGHKPSEPVFGMLARVCYTKAQDLLVQGFLESKAIQKHGAHLVLAGNVENAEFLDGIRRIAGEEWGKHVHYVGLISNVARFYETIDIACNSRRDTEAFGISVAEAAFMRRPVIAYFLGGPSEIVRDGVTGWLVRGRTARDYGRAIDLALTKKNEWEQMGEQCYHESAKFDAETSVEKLMDIIHVESCH